MKPRTEKILKLLKKSTSATLTIPADFLNSEVIDYGLADELNDAITDLKQDAGLEVTTSEETDNCIVTISIIEEDI